MIEHGHLMNTRISIGILLRLRPEEVMHLLEDC
jgi:hypothetical protein